MNNLKTALSLVLICVFTLVSAQHHQTDRKERKARKEEAVAAQVKERIANKDIVLSIYQIHPTGGRTVNSTDGYRLKLKNDSCTCYLPYFGRARSPMYGNDNLAIEVKDQKVVPQYSYTEKDGHVFEFTAKIAGNGEKCSFRIQIFDNGGAKIGCTLTSRDYISYSAEMAEE